MQRRRTYGDRRRNISRAAQALCLHRPESLHILKLSSGFRRCSIRTQSNDGENMQCVLCVQLPKRPVKNLKAGARLRVSILDNKAKCVSSMIGN
ncbi:unnamed protein product [Microthlaspi erraticum]|uniref:Uncharacterized protein n=1 Tax=Microthlaspi erraticum TaxID=1685480 RepID=A0A6D2KV56_9BRAS|nr:unnamed protein product [Microthlaspi erraticum]